MPMLLSAGPLIASLFLFQGTLLDAGLWIGAALCCGLATAAARLRRDRFGFLGVGAAVVLASLALVSPTP